MSLQSASFRRTAFLCGLGILLEGYDFAIFGALLPVLSRLFFPANDPVVATINGFAVFALGFLIRPFAGAVFGSIADRLGRKPAILLSTALMTLPTVAIGCLPTYAEIGLSAALLLIGCRMLQGFAFSGDYMGTLTYLSECAPVRQRHFILSLGTQAGVLGVLLGSLIGASIIVLFAEDSLLRYGWRLPFLSGALLGICTWVMRLKLTESPLFQSMQSKGEISKHPLQDVLQNYKKRAGLMIGLCFINSVAFYILFVYLPVTWVASGMLSASRSLWTNAAQLVLLVLALLWFSRLADRKGGYPVLIGGIGGFVILSFPMLACLNSGHLGLSLLAQSIFGIGNAAILATIPVMYMQLFPSHVRASGVTLSYNLAASLQGGTAPLIMQALAGSTLPLFWQGSYIMLAAIISLYAAIKIQSSGITRSVIPT